VFVRIESDKNFVCFVKRDSVLTDKKKKKNTSVKIIARK